VSDATRPEAPARILYCNCTWAKVVPKDVKGEVLRRLSGSSEPFEAVADLCEMSARRDPSLARIAGAGPVRIVACYPRAVRGLFQAAGAPLPASGVEVLNMREESAEEISERLLPAAAVAGRGR
jgi:hypothetical protein